MDWNRISDHEVIGECTTTVNEMRNAPVEWKVYLNNNFTIADKHICIRYCQLKKTDRCGNTRTAGTLHLHTCTFIPARPTFNQYIKRFDTTTNKEIQKHE
jgi:hypothetical protein